MSVERRRGGRDPLGPIFGALVLIWLGVVLLAAQNPEMFPPMPYQVTWSNVWGFFLAGLGALMVVEAFMRAVMGYRQGITGRVIWGVILLLIGLSGILPGIEWGTIWPFALIVLGVGLLLTNLLRR